MIDEYDIDGVYLDGVTEPFGCSNELHGCGYLGDDGQPRKTYPIFAVRDMMRRMRNIIKMRKPDALISAQVSAGVTIPTLAFVDVYSNGRHLDVQERGVRLVLDAFLAEFMGSNYGVPAEFLSCEDGGVSFEEALGVALVHDVLVGPSVHDDKLETMSKVWRAWDDFGVNSARWIPHWKEVGPVTSDDADALISSYVKRGGALSVITNAGERSRHFELHIDADALGLDSDRLAVSDALTEEALEVRRGLVRVKLDPLHMIMLRVREAAQEAR